MCVHETPVRCHVCVYDNPRRHVCYMPSSKSCQMSCMFTTILANINCVLMIILSDVIVYENPVLDIMYVFMTILPDVIADGGRE